MHSVSAVRVLLLYSNSFCARSKHRGLQISQSAGVDMLWLFVIVSCYDWCCHRYCLNPAGNQPLDATSGAEGKRSARTPSKEETDQFGMRYNQHLNRWTYPFQFSPVNSRIVRRSAALLGYSPNFMCDFSLSCQNRLSASRMCCHSNSEFVQVCRSTRG